MGTCYASQWRAKLGALSRYQTLDQIARIMVGNKDFQPSKALENAGLDVSVMTDDAAVCFQSLVAGDTSNNSQVLNALGQVSKQAIPQLNTDGDKAHLTTAEVGKGTIIKIAGDKEMPFIPDWIASYPIILSVITSTQPSDSTSVTDNDIPTPIVPTADTDDTGSVSPLGAGRSIEEVAGDIAQTRTIVIVGVAALLLGGAWLLGRGRGRVEGRIEGEHVGPPKIGFVARARLRTGLFSRGALKGDIEAARGDVSYQETTVQAANRDAATKLGVDPNDAVTPQMMHDLTTAQARVNYLEGVQSGAIDVPWGAGDWLKLTTWVGSIGYGIYQWFSRAKEEAPPARKTRP